MKEKFSHPLYKTQHSDWISEAVELLGKKGVSHVNISTLSKKLKTTKGSFYWHFKSKKELLTEVLDTFEQRSTIRILETVEKNETAIDKLKALFRLTFAQTKPEIYLELAIRDWARHDPSVFKRCKRIDQIRIQYCEKLLEEAGIDNPKNRAFGAYAFVVGSNLVPEFLTDDYTEASIQIMQLITSGQLSKKDRYLWNQS